jgi:CopG family transcriptional regulator, nickel-responsive regulator
MAVVSISMPEALLDRLDGFANEHGYTGRSEVVREGARGLLTEFDDPSLEGRRLSAVVSALFDHDTERVERRMRRLRHEHESLVAANVHQCLGDDHCMEVFVLAGTFESISEFVSTVRATSDLHRVEHSILPLDEGLAEVET